MEELWRGKVGESSFSIGMPGMIASLNGSFSDGYLPSKVDFRNAVLVTLLQLRNENRGYELIWISHKELREIFSKGLELPISPELFRARVKSMISEGLISEERAESLSLQRRFYRTKIDPSQWAYRLTDYGVATAQRIINPPISM